MKEQFQTEREGSGSNGEGRVGRKEVPETLCMMDELVRKRGGVRRGSFKRKMTQTAAVMKRGGGMLGNRTCGDLITKRVLLSKHKDKTLNVK